MDRAVASLVLLVSHSGTKYVSSLKCEAERESAAMHSCSEEAVGYKAIIWLCKDAWLSLTLWQSYVSVRVPEYLCIWAHRSLMVSETIRHYSAPEDGPPVQQPDQCNLEFTEGIYIYDWEDAEMMEVIIALPSCRAVFMPVVSTDCRSNQELRN